MNMYSTCPVSSHASVHDSTWYDCVQTADAATRHGHQSLDIAWAFTSTGMTRLLRTPPPPSPLYTSSKKSWPYMPRCRLFLLLAGHLPRGPPTGRMESVPELKTHTWNDLL
jgi:hypothetical protein